MTAALHCSTAKSGAVPLGCEECSAWGQSWCFVKTQVLGSWNCSGTPARDPANILHSSWKETLEKSQMSLNFRGTAIECQTCNFVIYLQITLRSKKHFSEANFLQTETELPGSQNCGNKVMSKHRYYCGRQSSETASTSSSRSLTTLPEQDYFSPWKCWYGEWWIERISLYSGLVLSSVSVSSLASVPPWGSAISFNMPINFVQLLLRSS